jgi:Signal transduction histidine kinase regulating C4-dicarboxylate transport system
MRPWQAHESDQLDKSLSLPGLWLFYVLAALGVLVSLFLYLIAINHHSHGLALNAVPTDFASRIPVLQLPAKFYEPETLETILLYVAPIFGLLIAMSIMLSLRLIRISRLRALTLSRINEALKKEMADKAQMEATHKKLEKALLHGQKLQAIGTLAGGIAHDFNNLLYAIIGYVEMSQEDVTKDSLVYNNLGKALEASHRGQDLISRILTFSRRQHHEFKAVALKSTIDSALSLLKPTIPSSVIMDCQLKISDEFMVWGDQTQLQQLLVNIINNAVDAMNREGQLHIVATSLQSDDSFLELHPDLNAAAFCLLTITDSGNGMDESIMERIFEPFFTTKEVGKGTGLGLATAHAIIEEHQGEISVASQLGAGTTFTLYLPEYTPTNANKGV